MNKQTDRSNAVLALIESANNLNSIVEGIPSVQWVCDGRRLAYTKEWCDFYRALSKVNDETSERTINKTTNER